MKIFRFMSKEDLKNIKNGETLKNNTKHDGLTNSVGFCFLNTEDYEPERALHFLSGIATLDICAVFETDKKLKETYGVYATPIKATGNLFEDLINLYTNYNSKFKATEYCTTEYNSKDFKLLKYSENLYKQWEPREEQSELIWKKI